MWANILELSCNACNTTSSLTQISSQIMTRLYTDYIARDNKDKQNRVIMITYGMINRHLCRNKDIGFTDTCIISISKLNLYQHKWRRRDYH